MNQSEQIARRLEAVILNGTWIANTNMKAQIMELDHVSATERWQNYNSIAMLTFHLNYYIAGILEVFDGGDLTIRDKFSFDMPVIGSESEWADLRQQLFDNTERLVVKITQMPVEQLDQVFVDPAYGDYRRNIAGLIEHCYYHLGQVVLLKKMLK